MLPLYRGTPPIVSVVLPTYNRADYLARGIDSLLAQTYEHWELIVVDDGSEDHTHEVVDVYIKKHHNVRYIKHANRRLALSRNVGIHCSTGTFVTFLDSDDEYKNDHLSHRINYMLAHPDVDLLYNGAEVVGDPYVKDKNDLSKKIHVSHGVIGATFFGKRAVFINLGGFRNIAYSSESDLYERAIEKYIVKKVEHPSYIYYRDTPDSITNMI